MKIVVASDAHPDVVTMGVPRFDEVEQGLRQAVTHATSNKADAFLFTGDLVDPDSGGATFRAIGLVTEMILQLATNDVRSIWIAGNHDVCEDGSGATVLSPLAPLQNYPQLMTRIVEKPALIHLQEGTDGVCILCLPFMPVSHGVDMGEAVKRLWPNHKQRVIVAAHLSIPGIIPGTETTEMPRGREVVFPFEETKDAYMRLNGHYHRRQWFDPGDGGPPIIIPGSLARLTYGEEDHKPGFLVLEV